MTGVGAFALDCAGGEREGRGGGRPQGSPLRSCWMAVGCGMTGVEVCYKIWERTRLRRIRFLWAMVRVATGDASDGSGPLCPSDISPASGGKPDVWAFSS